MTPHSSTPALNEKGLRQNYGGQYHVAVCSTPALNLETAVDVGANSFAHSDSYVRMNSHPQIPFKIRKLWVSCGFKAE